MQQQQQMMPEQREPIIPHNNINELQDEIDFDFDIMNVFGDDADDTFSATMAASESF